MNFLPLSVLKHFQLPFLASISTPLFSVHRPALHAQVPSLHDPFVRVLPLQHVLLRAAPVSAPLRAHARENPRLHGGHDAGAHILGGINRSSIPVQCRHLGYALYDGVLKGLFTPKDIHDAGAHILEGVNFKRILDGVLRGLLHWT